MPHYRINIKIEKEAAKEYIIEDERKEVDIVYNEYRRRVNEKNGAGRVIYFDLVMIAEESLLHLGDRKEIFHEVNNFGLDDTAKVINNSGNRKNLPKSKPTLEQLRKK